MIFDSISVSQFYPFLHNRTFKKLQHHAYLTISWPFMFLAARYLRWKGKRKFTVIQKWNNNLNFYCAIRQWGCVKILDHNLNSIVLDIGLSLLFLCSHSTQINHHFFFDFRKRINLQFNASISSFFMRIWNQLTFNITCITCIKLPSIDFNLRMMPRNYFFIN